MLYLIPHKSIISNYLSSPELIKVQDYTALNSILFPKITDKPASYNADVLITYAALKRLSDCDSNHTKKHADEELESRIKKIGNYKKKNIDIFILETSKSGFDKTKTKLENLTHKHNIQFDSSLSQNFFIEMENSFESYYSKKVNTSKQKQLTDIFFQIKNTYNKSKIPNLNRLTTNGLSKFDDWFFTDYIPYKHVESFSKSELKIPSGHKDEKNLFELFGYRPTDSIEFSSEFYKYLKSLIKKSGFTIHKLCMICKYYLFEKCETYYDYKPSYEYIILGKRRAINRTFLIYLSIALGLTVAEIKKLFILGNCVLTDFLPEDILLLFFAENHYIMDVKQKGCLFNYLRVSKIPLNCNHS